VAEPLRLGLVGCGRIAEHGYLPALARSSRVQLVAVADPLASRRALVPAAAGFDGIEPLLAAVEVDAIVIASPPASHLSDAAAAAAAGIPALVEKPPGRDLAEAKELAALGPPPRLGFNRRFDARWQAFERTLQHRVATSISLRLELSTGDWRPAGGDDALLDLGVHLADLALRLAGPVRSVRAAELDAAHARLELESARGEVELELAHGRAYRERAEAAGIAGLDASSTTARLRDRLRRTADRPLPASLARQLDAFAAAVRGEAAPNLATAEDGVAVLRILDAARRSAASGGTRIDLH